MPRTFIRQATQIRHSSLYNDTLAAGATLETSAVSIEDDLNAVRSQLKRFLYADAAGKWYDDAPLIGGVKKGLVDVANDINATRTKTFLFRTQVLTDITVTTGQNYEILSVAGNETPTQTAAVGAVSTEGAVVAAATTFGAHNLDVVAGPSPLRPANLCIVRDAATGQPIQSAGKDVYALLQSESAVDGHTFNDTNQRVQLSFVRENPTGDGLEAVPAADIGGKTINYSYVRRAQYQNLPDSAFLLGVFLDQTASTDVTLDNAVDNQSGPVTQTQTIAWQIGDTFAFAFQDPTGSRNLFYVSPSAAGDAVSFDADTLTVTTVNDSTFTQGMTVDSGGTPINIGVTAGQIDASAPLTLASQGAANDLFLKAGLELYLDDLNKAGSTWTLVNGIKLSDTSAEWDAFKTAFGEVSLLNAIQQASQSGTNRVKGVAIVTAASIAANTNVTGAGASPNLDAQLPDYSTVNFVTDVDVYLNGELLRNGADATANHDVYPGDAPATGDLKFEFDLEGGSEPDVITMIVWK